MNAITQGCLRQITDENADPVVDPIVQCVQIKPMNSQNGAERYRVVMSDTANFMQGMLGQREYNRVRENEDEKTANRGQIQNSTT